MNDAWRELCQKSASWKRWKKLASRINSQIESVRDIVEDLEIEFELLQTQISKLEAKKGSRKQEDEEEILDIENTSSVTVKPKFWMPIPSGGTEFD